MNKESRQLLNFLKKQNQMLKDDISQLKQVLKLNKEALQVSLRYKNEQNYDKYIPQLIKLLYEQNGKLHSRIDQLRTQIQSGMCKALISQQIAFASTQQQVLLTNELRDKLQKMRKQLQSRQNKIIQLTKIQFDDKNPSSAQGNHNLEHLRLIQYSDMTKVTKKMKDTVQKLNQQLDLNKQEIEKLKDGKQQLFKLNLILTKQLNEMKFLSSCQTTKSNNEMSLQLSNNDMTKYLKYQKKLVNEEANIYEGEGDIQSDQGSSSGISDSNQSQIDQFPSEEEYNDNQKDQTENNSKEQSPAKQHDKINKSMQVMVLKPNMKNLAVNEKAKMNMTLNLGALGLKKGIQSKCQSKAEQKLQKFNIPKLQLTKAKQIQNLIVKKINNDQKKKKQTSNQVVKQEKYKKLEQELENLRKKLGNEILQKLAFERQCNFMKKIIAQLEQRNTLLVQRKIMQEEQQNYEQKRKNNEYENMETLLDICRDVTLNQRLRRVVLGKQLLQKKIDIESLEI